MKRTTLGAIASSSVLALSLGLFGCGGNAAQKTEEPAQEETAKATDEATDAEEEKSEATQEAKAEEAPEEEERTIVAGSNAITNVSAGESAGASSQQSSDGGAAAATTTYYDETTYDAPAYTQTYDEGSYGEEAYQGWEDVVEDGYGYEDEAPAGDYADYSEPEVPVDVPVEAPADVVQADDACMGDVELRD